MSAVSLRIENAVAEVILDHPDDLNSWSRAMATELRNAFARIAEDCSARSVLLTGAGRAFCAGADLKQPPSVTPNGHPDLRHRAKVVSAPVIRAVRELPKPVVAAISGPWGPAARRAASVDRTGDVMPPAARRWRSRPAARARTRHVL